MTAIAPITRPRSPPTILPPCAAISTGSRKVSMYGWMEASFAFGSHPASMNRAVIKPHAINAPMFGITMPLRNLPNRCTAFFMFYISYPSQVSCRSPVSLCRSLCGVRPIRRFLFLVFIVLCQTGENNQMIWQLWPHTMVTTAEFFAVSPKHILVFVHIALCLPFLMQICADELYFLPDSTIINIGMSRRGIFLCFHRARTK